MANDLKYLYSVKKLLQDYYVIERKNDEIRNIWLAYMVLICMFPSLALLHLLQYGGALYFDILPYVG